jgi:hypothetical protein
LPPGAARVTDGGWRRGSGIISNAISIRNQKLRMRFKFFGEGKLAKRRP